ncbi:bone morphogenetic protein 2 [Folsomia candida]|uniref:bone morphogenetic protein 2 n=1 Tax=Folsomia candida TaxID=158441 RepID=UPI001604A4FE|nr:bone morphogenetic protein 2 [Folsomia candida]
MQCVTVGRMELPLNLFPFYVLLLLLSLSQGRPPQGKNHSHHHSLAEGEQVGRSSRSTSSSSRNLPWEESSLVEEGGDDVVVDDGDDGNDQAHYRNSILRELGLENAYIPTMQKPILNISKEEYVAAYKEYMTNVRKRKEDAWKDVGPKRRRKNAVTKIRIFYDEGITDGEDNTTTFHFDINSNKDQESGKIIRIKRAELELPEGCRPLLNATKILGGDDRSYDVSSAVTSWLFSRKNKMNPSRPFTVSCSPLDSSSTPARLRLVTSEMSKNRTRRSVLPSTLQALKLNKPRSGVDCTKTRRGKTCCRRSLKIKFSDLGISEVIIEPAEFDAHVCVGRCNAKRVSYSSTHAIFQHILHEKKGKGFVPRPCCAPTKLAELDVIHINSVNPSKPKLEVTVLKDAIVSECGCS